MIKMKKNIALLLVLLVAGSAFAANPKLRKNSRTEMGINGNAIYVIEYTYNIHGGRDGGRQLVCIDSITFDKRGNFADKFRTKADDYTWYSYFFDVNGYSLGWNEYNREKLLTGRTAYLNDKDGNRIERTVFLGNQMTKKESSRFVGGQKVEEQSFDADGQMTEKRTYKYDQKGNCIEMEFYTSGASTTPTSSSRPSPPTTTTTTTTSSKSAPSTMTSTSTGNTPTSTSTTRTTTGSARPSTATTCPTRSSSARSPSLRTDSDETDTHTPSEPARRCRWADSRLFKRHRHRCQNR